MSGNVEDFGKDLTENLWESIKIKVGNGIKKLDS